MENMFRKECFFNLFPSLYLYYTLKREVFFKRKKKISSLKTHGY